MMGATMTRTLEAWGHVPDWIEAMAHACDKPKQSQRTVAADLGVSVTTVNLLLKNKYAPRDHTDMEDRVRNTLMVAIINCPALGLIGRDECQQKQAQPLVTCSPVIVQQFRACRNGCRYFDGKE